MEQSRWIASDADEARIRARVTVGALSSRIANLTELLACGAPQHAQCLWGDLRVAPRDTPGGVAFVLEGCPNALSWTVIDHGERGVQIRATLRGDDEALLTSLDELVEVLAQDVTRALAGEDEAQAHRPSDAPACGRLAGASHLR